MKKTLFIFILLILTFFVYCQDYELGYNRFGLNPGWGLKLENGIAQFDGDEIIEINYEVNIENNIQFIEFYGFPPGIVGFRYKLDYERQLWLTTTRSKTGPPSIFATYISDNSEPELIQPNTKWGGSFTPAVATSSSNYAEQNKTYYAENILDLRLSNPWVEDKDGYGVGETITLSYERPIHVLYFSNGFVSFEKTHLYTDNSRVKQIELENLDENTVITINILDTPNIQEIRLDKPMQNIVIRITDIYLGEKWEDTCINFIVGDSWDSLP